MLHLLNVTEQMWLMWLLVVTVSEGSYFAESENGGERRKDNIWGKVENELDFGERESFEILRFHCTLKFCSEPFTLRNQRYPPSLLS